MYVTSPPPQPRRAAEQVKLLRVKNGKRKILFGGLFSRPRCGREPQRFLPTAEPLFRPIRSKKTPGSNITPSHCPKNLFPNRVSNSR